jgi:hypothetical protein
MENFTNPLAPTLATTYDATISGSTTVTLNSGTTYIEVTALLKGIFMKWGATASSSSFDEFIAPESTRTYVVPDGTTSVQFIEEAASAHLVVIEK